MHRRKAVLLAVALLLAVLAGAQESGTIQFRTVSTDGVLSSVPVPTSWQGRYNRARDVVVLLEPGSNQIVLFPYAGVAVREAVAELLSELGGPGYTDRIREVTIGGVPASSIRIDVGGESRDWILATERDGIVVAVWARTGGSLESLQPVVATVLSRLQVAERRRPEHAAGSYTVPAPERILTLRSDGRLLRSGSGGEVQLRGSWELRGERLLLASGESFSNFRVDIGERAITVFGSDGREREWKRR